jgi:hypothetical protein
LARDHQFFEPRPTVPERRAQINSALLTGNGAEMAFASSLLLVEGEGDRLFFERLRRRLAIDSGDSRIDRLYVLAVGGKTNFAPWLQLLNSYGEVGNRPISWLIVADDDAAKDVREAYAAAAMRIAKPVLEALTAQHSAFKRGAVAAEKRRLTLRLNKLAVIPRFRLLPGELEGTMLARTSEATRKSLAKALEAGAPTGREEMVTWLLNSSRKGPWMRATIGDRLPWNELDDTLVEIMIRWVRGAVPRPREAKAIVEEVRGT